MKIYHKKCTDRKKTTVNWKKSPWYCSICMTSSQDIHPHQLSPVVSVSDPGLVAVVTTSTDHLPTYLGKQSTIAAPVVSVSSAPPATTQSRSSSSPISHTSASQPLHTAPTIVFPNNSVRQRSSNVNINNSPNITGYMQEHYRSARVGIKEAEGSS